MTPTTTRARDHAALSHAEWLRCQSTKIRHAAASGPGCHEPQWLAEADRLDAAADRLEALERVAEAADEAVGDCRDTEERERLCDALDALDALDAGQEVE